MKRIWTVAQISVLSLLFLFGGLDSLYALAGGKHLESNGSAKRNVSMVPSIPQAQAAPAGTASVTGKVSLEGTVPKMRKIKMAADPVCLQQHGTPVYKQEIVSKGGKLQYAFVYVKEGVEGTYPAPKEPVVLDQIGCMYEPHVFGIQTGQKLEIRNSDSTLHNVNCKPKANKRFNIAQPVKGMKSKKSFTKPEVMVPFRCNVHPWMTAYAGVVDHPFFAVSGEDGSFKLAGLPAGTYTLEAWHEKLGTRTQTVTLAEGESKEIAFSFKTK